MAGLGDLFGKGSIAEQLFVWDVLGQIINSLASPYFESLTQEVNVAHPVIELSPPELAQLVVRELMQTADGKAAAARSGISGGKFDDLVKLATPYLSPADLAQLVIRNFMTHDAARDEAINSGVTSERFDLLLKIAAESIAPQEAAAALRRGIIPEDSANEDVPSFGGAIREGRLGDKWIPVIKALAVEWPTPTDALQARLEGQVDDAEGRALYERFGGDPAYFDLLYNTRGNAPTPVEALELLNRGIIAERGTGPASTSYEQAFLEGPWRDKWLDPFLALRQYVIPPRSVVAMVHQGTFTDAEAAAELAKSGVAPNLAAALIAEGHARANSASKELTVSTITSLYADRIITTDQAHGLLTALGYTDQDATYRVELVDLQREVAALKAAVSRVQSLYIGHKITRDAAVQTLTRLEVPADQVSEILHIWDLEQAVNVKQLTPAQIVDAWHEDIIKQDEAIAELQVLGYTAYDAWLLLSIKAKKGQPGKPPQGANPVSVIP